MVGWGMSHTSKHSTAQHSTTRHDTTHNESERVRANPKGGGRTESGPAKCRYYMSVCRRSAQSVRASPPPLALRPPPPHRALRLWGKGPAPLWPLLRRWVWGLSPKTETRTPALTTTHRANERFVCDPNTTLTHVTAQQHTLHTSVSSLTPLSSTSFHTLFTISSGAS